MADLPVKTRRRKYLLSMDQTLYNSIAANAARNERTVAQTLRLAAIRFLEADLAATPPPNGKRRENG